MRQTIYKVEYSEEGKEISCIRYEEVINEQHEFPIGSLVEVTKEDFLVEVGLCDNSQLGLRLFVVNQDHDINGTPLYDLSFNKDSYEGEQLRKSRDSHLSNALYYISVGSQLKGIPQERLKLIK